jgi:hypothetical protein
VLSFFCDAAKKKGQGFDEFSLNGERFNDAD